MKKFLLGIVAGAIFAVLAGVVFVFSAIRFGEARPVVADGSTLILTLSGDVPEKAPVSIPIPFLGTPTPLTVHEIWSGLRRAATDSRVKAVVLVIGNVDAGWAKISQIRDDLQNFRKSGKPVYAFMRSPSTRDYYLACASDRLYAAPEDRIDLKGLRAEIMYFKNALNKIGVEIEIQHVGKYKDAGDIYSQTGMSPETRETMNMLLDGIYGQVVESIAGSRKKTPAEIRSMIDDGPYTSSQAAAKGVVDGLRFEDQVYGDLKDRLKQGDLKKLSFRDYLRGLGPEREGKRIALVVGEGEIVRGRGQDAMGTDEGFSSGAFIEMLRSVASDPTIAGVILRVDSPGGDAFASDEILREVKLLRDKKPMVISMSDTAASGGYYVAMTGDPVIAYPNTFTGSIGVFFGKVNLRGLYDKLGIHKEIMTRGQNAAIDSDYGPISPEARAKLQVALEETYTTFVTKVADGRKRKYQEVEPLAQGRVWLGSHAKDRGLVDELGGLDQAVAAVRKKAGFKAGEAVRLVPFPPKRSLIDQWMKSTMQTATEAATMGQYFEKITGMKIRALLDGGVLRLMPYSVRIR